MVAAGGKVMRTDLQVSKGMAEGRLKPKWVGPREIFRAERSVADLCREEVVAKNGLKLLKMANGSQIAPQRTYNPFLFS